MSSDPPLSLMAGPERAREIQEQSRRWPSFSLDAHQSETLELLLTGGFTPLRGFMTRSDRGPASIVLNLPAKAASACAVGSPLALRDGEGVLLAALQVLDLWKAAAGAEGAEEVWSAGGRVEGVALPVHHDFCDLRRTPEALRAEFQRRGWTRVVAFPVEGFLHRADLERAWRACREEDAALLAIPLFGDLPPGDPEPFSRLRALKAALARTFGERAMVAVLPLGAEADPRETARRQAWAAESAGCTHLLLAPPEPGAGEARGLETPEGLRLRLLRPPAALPKGEGVAFSAAELRAALEAGKAVPEGFTFPEVEAELRRSRPPRNRRGFTVFFTGLSGSGKSTTARILLSRLLERAGRPVTLLDGDLVRRHLSSELGFSKEHRDLNIRRIGYVAYEITKHGGIALCCPIAPYDVVRREVRRMVEGVGGFVLVHMATSIATCESRDRKGLYAKARSGLIGSFTGISDPYEAPTDAEIALDAGQGTPEEGAARILAHLEAQGFLAPPERA